MPAISLKYFSISCLYTLNSSSDGLTEAVEQLRQQAEAGGTATAETLAELDRRLTLVENGWNINYKHF